MKKTVGSIVLAIAMQFSTSYAQDIPLSERFTLDGCYTAAKSQRSRDAAVAAAAAQYRREVLAAQAKEARKTRAAYLISYIISVGNWIDDHPETYHGERVAQILVHDHGCTGSAKCYLCNGTANQQRSSNHSDATREYRQADYWSPVRQKPTRQVRPRLPQVMVR